MPLIQPVRLPRVTVTEDWRPGDGVGRDREPDPGRGAARPRVGGGKRGDADHLAGQVDQGTAAVTGVDGRAGLDCADQDGRTALAPETVRPVAETIPSVTVPARPSGLPMASTISPTRTAADRPNDAGCSEPDPACTLITARSSGANTPTTPAVSGVPPLGRPTWSVVAGPAGTFAVTSGTSGSASAAGVRGG
jgi:hypothetical protein